MRFFFFNHFLNRYIYWIFKILFKENSNNKYSRLTFGRDWVNAFIKRHPNLTIPAYKRYQKKKKVQEDSQKDTQKDGKFSPAFSTKDFFFRPSIYI